MKYEEFFNKIENKKYGKYKDNMTVKSVFEFISKPENIDKMIISTNQNRPALEGIIEDIEIMFPNDSNFNIETDYTLRKALGSIVKYVLLDFGYEVSCQKNISKGNYIKSATQYIYNPEKAIKRLVKTISIEEII